MSGGDTRRRGQFSTQFGIFAKHWRPGRVKTRLARDLGDDAAAQLSRAFLATLLLRFSAIAERQLLCFTPAAAVDAFASLPIARWELSPQVEGNLGQRMQHYFDSGFEHGMQRGVLIGSDSPDLPREYVDRAFEMLASHDVVLGPSIDGGYYLVGASQRTPPIFADIAWSTPQVWTETLERLRQACIAPALLPP